jgi:hypothetical protein
LSKVEAGWGRGCWLLYHVVGLTRLINRFCLGKLAGRGLPKANIREDFYEGGGGDLGDLLL